MNKITSHTEQNLTLAYENHQKGNLKLAESIYKKILKVDKDNFKVLFLLGTLMLQNKNFIEAEALLKKSIKINPDNANTYQNLGFALIELGRFREAKELFYSAIKIEPKHVDAHFNLGNTYKQLRDFKKAQIFYEKTIAIKPNNTSALNNLGNVYKKLGNFEKAIDSYNKAIQILPNHARAYHNLANTFNQLGEFDKAVNCLKKVIKYQPYNLESIYTWSDIDEKILNIALKKQIQMLMENKNLPKKDLAYGYFLLAKYELQERNYEKELDYLLEGHENYFKHKNNFFEKGVKYWLKQLPKENIFKSLGDIEVSDNIKPIFIIGVPRCGSTVIEKIIASGPKNIPIGEETGTIGFLAGQKILQEELEKKENKKFKDSVISKYEELGLITKKSDFVFTDKSLDNFFFVEIIAKLFPNAKIIHCKRNAISSIMSILKNNLGDVSWAHKIDHILKYFDNYYKIMSKNKIKFPRMIYELNFDHFRSDPEPEAKKLFKFCDLPWNKKCLEYYKRKDLVSYTASHKQIRGPIFKDSLIKNDPYKILINKYGKKYSWFN
jgi:tetratricopeptide (TPR) repeat protein